MKKNFILLIFISLLSCVNKFDETIIIGSSVDSLPYKTDRGMYGWKIMNGVEHFVSAFYYKGIIICYVMDQDIVIDYYFSKAINFVNIEKARNMPLGTSNIEIKKIFGEPAFYKIIKNYDDTFDLGSEQKFYYTYLQKWKSSIFGSYDLAPVPVDFYFNEKGELVNILIKYHAP